MVPLVPPCARFGRGATPYPAQGRWDETLAFKSCAIFSLKFRSCFVSTGSGCRAASLAKRW
eukprot:3188405-Lingulodinium_polyedra.AAC.1